MESKDYVAATASITKQMLQSADKRCQYNCQKEVQRREQHQSPITMKRKK